MKKILSLCYNDFKNILREPMLVFLMLGPILLTIALRWIIPFFTETLITYIDLKIYYPLITGFVVLFIPILMGMLTGFILLDERDDYVFMTLITTPLSKEGYILYRILLPMVISFIYSIAIIPIINLISFSFITIIPIAVLTALEAPLVALYLVVFAGNKVEGLALTKALSFFMIAPLVGYVIKSNWKYLLGLLPTYWGPMALVVGDIKASEYWIHIVLGLIVNLSLLYIPYFYPLFESYNL